MTPLTKDAILELPPYDGVTLNDIVVVNHKDQADEALRFLSQQRYVGFDTESIPARYRRGKMLGPSIIQFATRDRAFLISTGFFFGMKTARAILTDANILKVGFGLSSDITGLQTHFDIEIENVEDLSLTVKDKIKAKSMISAQTVVGLILNKRLSKQEQTSNWGKSRLSEAQILYAANDAHAAFSVKRALSE